MVDPKIKQKKPSDIIFLPTEGSGVRGLEIDWKKQVSRSSVLMPTPHRPNPTPSVASHPRTDIQVGPTHTLRGVGLGLLVGQQVNCLPRGDPLMASLAPPGTPYQPSHSTIPGTTDLSLPNTKTCSSGKESPKTPPGNPVRNP